MKFNLRDTKDIYTGRVAQRYDYSMPPFFLSWKKKAYNNSSLKKGDKVLVLCCGTGLDFPYILSKIGKEGRIVGIDFSAPMLKSAQEKIDKENWTNIELIEADITEDKNLLNETFDAGACTLGLSIIPKYEKAYQNLLKHVKPGGDVIIGDMQLATGLLSIFNPITTAMAGKFGGSHEGHKNSFAIQKWMQHDLTQIRKHQYFLGAYYYSIGKKK